LTEKPAHLRLVVFDLDGTLVDSSQDLCTAINRMLAAMQPATRPLSHSQVRSFIGDGARMLVGRSLAAAGLAADVDAALPAFLAAYRDCLLDSTRFYPGVLDALDALRPLPLAVLTNKPGDLSRALLAGLGAGDRFVRVVGGGDAPRKPDPGGLSELMELCGAAPAETVLCGDSAIDVATARAAGAFAVGVDCGFGSAGFADAPPDLRLPSVAELPAALLRAAR
jgi:phosphoglycolate phosphatase